MSIPLSQYPQYVPLTPNEAYAKLGKIQAFWDEFTAALGFNGVFCRKKVLLDIIERVEKRRVYFRVFHNIVMSEQNEASLYCFWILKLAPFFNAKNPDHYVNTVFAVFLFLRVVNVIARRRGRQLCLNGTYVKNISYGFLYRDISKEAIMALAESLLA